MTTHSRYRELGIVRHNEATASYAFWHFYEARPDLVLAKFKLGPTAGHCISRDHVEQGCIHYHPRYLRYLRTHRPSPPNSGGLVWSCIFFPLESHCLHPRNLRRDSRSRCYQSYNISTSDRRTIVSTTPANHETSPRLCRALGCTGSRSGVRVNQVLGRSHALRRSSERMDGPWPPRCYYRQEFPKRPSHLTAIHQM